MAIHGIYLQTTEVITMIGQDERYLNGRRENLTVHDLSRLVMINDMTSQNKCV